MSTLTINIQELKRKTTEGAINNLKTQAKLERSARDFLYKAADLRFKTILPTILQRIEERASKDGETFYDHIILATDWDKAILDHVWYEGGFIWGQSVTQSSICTGFNHSDYGWEIVRKSDRIRDCKDFEIERRIVWMCTKKLAKYFLNNRFEVLIGQKEINITSEFQHHQRYKSSLHKLPCLRIVWSEK